MTISTYDFQRALQATAEDDLIYPYPRLDFSQIGPPTPRTYRGVVLENSFVSLTILPELGGRIYSWIDRTSGRQLLYQNPVVKPTRWGYREWWLAAGGIEWAFPVEEHGLNEWRPWQVSTAQTADGRSVTVRDVDDRTGMEVGATMTLHRGHATVTLQPWVRNPTEQAQSYQLWLNAMLALNHNRVSPDTRLILPADEVLIHSSGDPSVPTPGSVMSWPLYNGRDFSRYGNWNGWVGFFAPHVRAGFSAVYDPISDQGIVRTYSPGWPAGTKIFGPSTLAPEIWTDDDSNYIELWSGATSSFWSTSQIEPGATFGWSEYWYPVHGLGTISHANRTAALGLTGGNGHIDITLATSTFVAGRLALFVAGEIVAEWPIDMSAGQLFRAAYSEEGLAGPLGLRLSSEDGAVVIEMGTLP